MRGVSLRSILMGFGLGLVCISIILIFFLMRGNTENSKNRTDDHPVLSAADGALLTWSAVNPPILSDRVILLDGNAPRQITESEKMDLKNEILALAEEIAMIADSAVAPAPMKATIAQMVATTSFSTRPAETTIPRTAISTSAQTVSAPAITTTVAQAPATTRTTISTTTLTEIFVPATIASASIAVTTVPELNIQATAATARFSETAQSTTLSVPATPISVPSAYLEIVRGDTATIVANKLLNLGLISDTVAFLNRLSDLKLTGELLDGDYQLSYDLDLDTLIDKITVHK